MLRSLEHQMLEQMREAGVPRPFVFGSNVIPEIDGDDRAGMVLMDQDIEAIRQCVLAEG
jgi:hypothetical protein